MKFKVKILRRLNIQIVFILRSHTHSRKQYLHFALAEKRAFCVFHDKRMAPHSSVSCLEPSHAALLLEVMEVNRQLGGLSNRILTLSVSGACVSVCECVFMC